MNEDTLTTEELKKIYDARLNEIESQLAYIRMLRKNLEQDIIENNAEKELILNDLKRIRQEQNRLSDTYNGIDLTERWRNITRKMDDANTYNWYLFRNADGSTILTQGLKDEFKRLIGDLTRNYNELSKKIKQYENLSQKFASENDVKIKQALKEELEILQDEFITLENNFNEIYLELINYEQTRNIYDLYAQNDIEKKLEQLNVENTSQKELSNSRENVDRAKLLIYIEDYLRAYKEGKDITVAEFSSLKKYYKKNGSISNKNFPQFFKELTGIEFSVFNQENSIKIDKVRQILSKKQIQTLTDKEKLALKVELTEEDLGKDEEKKPLLSYLSLNEQEEELKTGKLKSKAKKLKADLAYGFDPYLNKNPLYQKRAKEIHEAVYVKMLEKGQIFSGLSDLGRLTEVESLRSDIPEMIKEYARNKVAETKSAVKQKVKAQIDERILGEGINSKGLRITTSIVDKARFLRRKKRKAKGLGKTLTKFIIKRIFDELVGKVVDTVKSAVDLVKNTTAASRMSNYFRGSSFGQSLQKFGTATLDTSKAVAKMPGEFVRGLLDKGDLAVKAIKANRFVIGLMDAGHIAKTAIGKAPRGLLYGAGVSSIALSLGIPVTGLLPFAVGGGLLGIGIETIDDLMHTPTFRPTSGLLRWIQSKGSALYRNPITGGFSNEIIQNNATIAENLKKAGNAFGGTGARLFSAVKTGLSGAMLAATIATLLGINPVVAGAATFGLLTAGKFALRTATGRSIMNGLVNNTYGHLLSRLAILPLQRMMFMVGTTQIMSNLVEDLVKTVKSGGSINDYYNRNFSLKDKSVIDKFLIINNYLGMYGYFTNYAFLTRLTFGKMMQYIIRGGEVASVFGSSEYTGFFSILKAGWNGLTSITSLTQLLSKIGMVIRGSFLPTFVLAGSTLVGLGIATLLGINIGGIGATVGALAGGLIGMGIGAFLTVGTAGLLSPLVVIGNLIGTTVGAWIGSLFDNSVDKIARNLFAVIGGISFIFTLIDMFNSKSMNLRKITMASLSFALTLPALSGVLERGSVQQSQANSTLPTPTINSAYYKENSNNKIHVINNSGYPIKTSDINKLTNQMYSRTPEYTSMEKYIILVKNEKSSIMLNDNTLIINLSVMEVNPEVALDGLIESIKTSQPDRTSQYK